MIHKSGDLAFIVICRCPVHAGLRLTIQPLIGYISQRDLHLANGFDVDDGSLRSVVIAKYSSYLLGLLEYFLVS